LVGAKGFSEFGDDLEKIVGEKEEEREEETIGGGEDEDEDEDDEDEHEDDEEKAIGRVEAEEWREIEEKGGIVGGVGEVEEGRLTDHVVGAKDWVEREEGEEAGREEGAVGEEERGEEEEENGVSSREKSKPMSSVKLADIYSAAIESVGFKGGENGEVVIGIDNNEFDRKSSSSFSPPSSSEGDDHEAGFEYGSSGQLEDELGGGEREREKELPVEGVGLEEERGGEAKAEGREEARARK